MTAPLVVAVTGSGQGIGLAVARRFAARGGRVVVSDIDAARCQNAAEDIGALGVPADVTDAAQCHHLVDRIVAAHGRLDVMVCNAGIMQLKPFLELDGTDWDRMLGVNVKGCFLSLQAAARQMLQQAPQAEGRPRGKIITMASIAGRPGAGPIAAVIPHYRASKAAVLSLTQSAAVALAPQLTVNAICPGLVESEMWRGMDRDWGALQGLGEGQVWQQRIAGIPLGRPQRPEDVADVATFLAAPESDYMTGQAINVDGGLMMS
ncbi:SDR family NAD(P)-dependent oxidoreductase [Pseudorhodoferax sp. Leaf267]|uniref:SDR family NAD(P)-dependent oxidoreductase n=1 Tax=Pseudorhodoferax sp. Leaf267 TaxID=1736316 RepID=UPI0009EC136F|nr:SDR family oxidoreductase [Pseudorhodoferax sp. Leaf267]